MLKKISISTYKYKMYTKIIFMYTKLIFIVEKIANSSKIGSTKIK